MPRLTPDEQLAALALAGDFGEEPDPQEGVENLHDILSLNFAIGDDEHEKRQRRRAQCKSWHLRFRLTSGSVVPYRYYCGLFRPELGEDQCQECFDRRRQQFRAEIEQVVYSEEQAFIWTRVPRELATKWLRDLDKGEYLRYPTAQGDVLVISGSRQEEFSAEIKELRHAADSRVYDMMLDNLDGVDWDTIASTPGDRRPSGKLGKPTKAKKDAEGTVKIKTKVISPTRETTADQMRQASSLAVDRTRHLDPKSAEELERDVEVFAEKLQGALVEVGGGVGRVTVTSEQVKLDDIDWQVIRKKYRAKAMGLPTGPFDRLIGRRFDVSKRKN